MQFDEVEDLGAEVTEALPQVVADDPADDPCEFMAVDSLGRRVDVGFVAGVLEMPTGNAARKLNGLGLTPSDVTDLVAATETKNRAEVLRIIREAANRT